MQVHSIRQMTLGSAFIYTEALVQLPNEHIARRIRRVECHYDEDEQCSRLVFIPESRDEAESRAKRRAR